MLRARSLVWIERRPPEPEVAGSNPAGPAIFNLLISSGGSSSKKNPTSSLIEKLRLIKNKSSHDTDIEDVSQLVRESVYELQYGDVIPKDDKKTHNIFL